MGDKGFKCSKHQKESRPESHLRHLPPSHELLEHYRSRLKKLDAEYESLSECVKECQAVCDNVSRLQQELLQRDSEVSHLQQAVSDLQVYVFQERQQVLTLYAENDRLKMKNVELLRRIEILRSLSGVSEEELTLFVKQTGTGATAVPRRAAPKKSNNQRQSERKGSGDAKLQGALNEASSDEIALLQLQIQALEAQLEEQAKLHEDEITALRQDRELSRAERIAERESQQQRLEEMAAELQNARESVCRLTSELVQVKQQHRSVEADWVSERDRLLKNLNTAKDQSGHSYTSKTLTLPGGGTKGCGVIAVLREQLAERERLLATYQEQCLSMEAEMTRLHEQTETSKALFKDKVQKMASQVTFLRNKYAELDRRRIVEAEGFRSDIRLMRARLRELERGFNKAGILPAVPSSGSRVSESSSNAGLDSTARDTMQRARQLESEIRNIRNKVMSRDLDLKVSKSKSSIV